MSRKQLFWINIRNKLKKKLVFKSVKYLGDCFIKLLQIVFFPSAFLPNFGALFSKIYFFYLEVTATEREKECETFQLLVNSPKGCNGQSWEPGAAPGSSTREQGPRPQASSTAFPPKDTSRESEQKLSSQTGINTPTTDAQVTSCSWTCCHDNSTFWLSDRLVTKISGSDHEPG